MERDHRPKANQRRGQKGQRPQQRQHSRESNARIPQQPDHGKYGRKAMVTFLEEKVVRRLASGREQPEDDGEIVALAEISVAEKTVGRAADDLSGAERHFHEIRIMAFFAQNFRVGRKAGG